jgi:hypothetical protein
MKKVFFVALCLLVAGCTDTTIANLSSYGSQGHIQCYSGGKLIYEGDSTGKLQTVSNSDGWEFKDSKTGKFIRVSGDCVISN